MSAKHIAPTLSPLAAVIADRAAKRAVLATLECAGLTPEQIAEHERKAAARCASDEGEIHAALSFNNNNERLNVGRECNEIVRSAFPDNASKTGKTLPHAQTKAIIVASVAVMRAIEGLSPEDADLVRAIILCEARNLSLALSGARGKITELAPLAGALLTVK
jgi:hypothetical protein